MSAAQPPSKSSQTIRLRGSDLLTPESFHNTFLTKLGFPSYYGHNMDAWIDIMSSGESEITVGNDGTLTIIIEDSKEGTFRQCEMAKELVECVEFINDERAGYEMLKIVFE